MSLTLDAKAEEQELLSQINGLAKALQARRLASDCRPDPNEVADRQSMERRLESLWARVRAVRCLEEVEG